MRTIDFRGKRVDNGEWVYGAYFCLHHNDERKHIHHFIIPDDVPIPKDKPIGEIQVEIIRETVGQYTGLLDKNGKEIYEGDIVKAIRFNFQIEIGVCRIDSEFGTLFEYKENGQECDFVYYSPQIESKSLTLEIIGNIHDNKELLK